ncbi:MAG TPA: serine hydrolase domain-containing protein [Acidobacteriota bacterium]|nr:serine hydrolase domain-containing protein [Acidobacteriota bacterium]
MGTISDSKVVDQRLEAVLRDLVSRKRVPHAIMAVARGDGSFRWNGAAGEAQPDGTPVKADTPYFIASVDKLFTATVILKLQENKLLDLDEPISTYVSESLIGGIHRLGGVDYTGTITVRHLLSHTSGLADWLEDRPKQGRSVADRLARDGDMWLSLDDMMRIVRDQLSPHFPPQPVETRRPKIRYSDTNYILLIAIIEAVTDQPLHKVHEKLLFQPLGLRRTWLLGDSKPPDPTPEPAMLWFGTKALEIPQLLQSTWAIYSTAEDTMRFMLALIRGELFDNATTLAAMQQRWNRFGLPLDRAALRLPSWPIEYGSGLMRFHDPILKGIGRLPKVLRPIYSAPAVIGHTGSTGSWLFYCPNLDLLFSGTVDQATAGALPFRLVHKVLRAVDDHRRSSAKTA